MFGYLPDSTWPQATLCGVVASLFRGRGDFVQCSLPQRLCCATPRGIHLLACQVGTCALIQVLLSAGAGMHD